MKPQEIFETVVRHCFQQGEPAFTLINGIITCMYRTKNGLKCAAGCLIPDEKYIPEMEILTAYQIFYHHPDRLPDFFGNNLELISNLQRIHDQFNFWESEKSLKESFISLGRKNNLDVSFINDLKLNKETV